MKIKTISRTEEEFSRATKLDIVKMQRNRDPRLHPFEKAREYTRALTATKLERMFAKPFVGALDGHADGVFSCCSVRNKLAPFISGACDGELRVWDLPSRKCVWSARAHAGFVRGVTADAQGESFFSCSDDKSIKQWPLTAFVDAESVEPLNTFLSPHPVLSIDHHWTTSQFVTAGEAVLVWDHARSEPMHKYSWGVDSVNCVRFNPAERSLFASTGSSDRSIVLYDLRADVPMRKIVCPMRTNALDWNPREPFNFVTANEDYNCYSFDIRKLDQALLIHKDHTLAVMDVRHSPTGKEFVSVSYDRTARIFNVTDGRSREVYHAKRMGRLFCVGVSQDAKFALTGGDDTNIRIWKMNASEGLGRVHSREERKRDYVNTLKKRYGHTEEIRRIANHRHVPSVIKKAQKIRQIQNESLRRKFQNRKRHSKPGAIEEVREKKRAVIQETS